MKILTLFAAIAAFAFTPAPTTAAASYDAELPVVSSSMLAAPIPGGGTIAVRGLTRRGAPICLAEARLFQNGRCVRGPKHVDTRGRVWFHNLPAGHYQIRLRNYWTGRRGITNVYLHRNQGMWVTVQVR